MMFEKAVCLQCEQSEQEVPLIEVNFQGEKYYICPQHLPILIHKPAQLAGKLPGADHLAPSEGHNH